MLIHALSATELSQTVTLLSEKNAKLLDIMKRKKNLSKESAGKNTKSRSSKRSRNWRNYSRRGNGIVGKEAESGKKVQGQEARQNGRRETEVCCESGCCQKRS